MNYLGNNEEILKHLFTALKYQNNLKNLDLNLSWNNLGNSIENIMYLGDILKLQ